MGLHRTDGLDEAALDALIAEDPPTAYEVRDAETAGKELGLQVKKTEEEKMVEFLNARLTVVTDALNLTRGTEQGNADLLKERLGILAQLWKYQYFKVCTSAWKSAAELTGEIPRVDEEGESR